jgi:uncharacterized membrane protein YkvI
VALAYLGAVIGAGFASGQEIVQFFVIYHPRGWWGTVIAGILFALMGGVLLYLCSITRVGNYQQLLQVVFGSRAGKAVDVCLSLFLFAGICVMFSASGAVFEEHLYLSKALGVFLAYACVLVLLAGGIRGLVFSYNLLVPLKILLLLLIVGCAAFFADTGTIPTGEVSISWHRIEYWGLAAVLYVAYNFALAMVVLCEYRVLVRPAEGILGAVLGGLMLGGMALLYYLAMVRYVPVILNYEVPMLFVAGNISVPVKFTYVIVLWIGIITTALADAYGFTQRLAAFTGISYRFTLLLVLTAALPLSFQSFSSLVAAVYPLFGVLGLVLVAGILVRVVSLRTLTKKQ